MDSKLIYDSNKIICSEPLHIGKSFLNFYNSFLSSDKVDPNDQIDNKDIRNQIEDCLKKYNKLVTSEVLDDVEKRCDVDLLQTSVDQPILNVEINRARKLYARQEPESSATLETLKCLKEFEEKTQNSKTNIALTADRYLKYRSNVMIENEPCENENNFILSPVITIRTYLPYKHDFGKRNTKGLPKFDREFKVLGATKLKEFRDALSCCQDLDTGEEKSLNPIKSTIPDDLGSALFYINGILYIDERYPYEEGYDYAKSLQDWGSRKKMDIRLYDMNELCFNDIYIRLGYPNVYQHRGCCEHVFVFSDIECAPNEFIPKINKFKYPMVTTIYNECKSYCLICYKYMATWVSINNKRTISEEFLWCNKCFLQYNYTEDMKKIGEFDAYKYFS